MKETLYADQENLYFALGMPIAFLVVVFVISLPNLLLKKEKKGFSFQYWLHRAPVEALIYQTIKRPYLREKIFKEIQRRKMGEVHSLLEILKDKRYPLNFRIQSLLALSTHPSQIRLNSLLAATYLEEPLQQTALVKLRDYMNKKVVRRLMEMLSTAKSPFSLTLVIKDLEFIVKGRNLPIQKRSPSELEGLKLLWLDWWEKNKNKSPLQWYLELYSKEDLSFQVQGIRLMKRYGLQNPSQGFLVFQTLIPLWNPKISPQVQISILKALNRLNPQKALPFLFKVLKTTDSEEVLEKSLGEVAFYLQGKQKKVRKWEKIRFLLHYLKDHKSWLVRKGVAKILGELGYENPEIVKILKNLLQDSQIEVRYQAAWSLEKLGYDDGKFLAVKDLDSPQNRLRAVVLLRGIYRRSFGLRADTTKEELAIIAKRWKRFLRNQGYLSHK